MLQWSYGAGLARRRASRRRAAALAREREVVAVDHARRVDLAREQRAGRVALAADVVAVLADADVEAPDLDVDPGSRPASRR